MKSRGRWRGRVVEGRLRGYVVEVRASGEPIPIYVIAVRHPERPHVESVDFAVGEQSLHSHFRERQLRILWEESREVSSSLLRDGRRASRLGLNRRATWRPKNLKPSGRRSKSPPGKTASGVQKVS